ncbi:hypothetical protein V8E52_008655 [Russula decolorans]
MAVTAITGYSCRLFGAPNGLCSSITESKHIKAVKEPWRRSSRFNALGQILVTNQRLDKLAACRVNFMARGMLNGPCLTAHLQPPDPPPPVDPNCDDDDDDDDDGNVDGPRVEANVTLARTSARGYPAQLHRLADRINQPNLQGLIRCFLFDQLYPDSPISSAFVTLSACPDFHGKATVFHSALATFYSPSDQSGIGGMHRQRIRSTPSWRKDDPMLPGFHGLHTAQVLLFFSIAFSGTIYPCALVAWFAVVGNNPCDQTGMWIVELEVSQGQRLISVIHLDCIFYILHTDSLSAFAAFYIGKFSDHHTHEVVF